MQVDYERLFVLGKAVSIKYYRLYSCRVKRRRTMRNIDLLTNAHVRNFSCTSWIVNKYRRNVHVSVEALRRSETFQPFITRVTNLYHTSKSAPSQLIVSEKKRCRIPHLCKSPTYLGPLSLFLARDGCKATGDFLASSPSTDLYGPRTASAGEQWADGKTSYPAKAPTSTSPSLETDGSLILTLLRGPDGHGGQSTTIGPS